MDVVVGFFISRTGTQFLGRKTVPVKWSLQKRTCFSSFASLSGLFFNQAASENICDDLL